MKDYIEREVLLNYIGKPPVWTGYNEPYTFDQHKAICVAITSLRKVVNEQPTADVQEIRHGEWIINSDGYYPYCSECGSEPKSGELTLYCPYCGAKMDKGE